MGCIVEFTESLLRTEFCSKGSKQKILIDILLKYSDMDINELSLALDVPVKKIRDIRNDKYFLMGEKENDLAQLFLIFFGRTFFRKFSIIRNYVN